MDKVLQLPRYDITVWFDLRCHTTALYEKPNSGLRKAFTVK